MEKEWDMDLVVKDMVEVVEQEWEEGQVAKVGFSIVQVTKQIVMLRQKQEAFLVVCLEEVVDLLEVLGDKVLEAMEEVVVAEVKQKVVLKLKQEDS